MKEVPGRFRAGSGEVPKQVPVMLRGKVPGRFRAGSGEVPKQVPVMLRGNVGAGSGAVPGHVPKQVPVMLRGKFRYSFRQVPGPVMLRGKFRHSFRQVPDRFRAGSGRFREGSGQVPASPGLELTSENGYGSSLIKHFYGSSQKELSTLSMARKDLQDVIVVVDSKEDTLESVL
ncbi:hypothetical protein AK812_SmicGene38728 [Symbiodinium microadriaticum]|uniref:Uncharacterized protein n=1 Tax=Symbiodinium microadriaticum TaxID=2951 RepID=A0A1Q9CD18_SYMMI|nr:hypothetical protein AK812_SmicGene38728 [Symbiodinium microadriaticum]